MLDDCILSHWVNISSIVQSSGTFSIKLLHNWQEVIFCFIQIKKTTSKKFHCHNNKAWIHEGDFKAVFNWNHCQIIKYKPLLPLKTWLGHTGIHFYNPKWPRKRAITLNSHKLQMLIRSFQMNSKLKRQALITPNTWIGFRKTESTTGDCHLTDIKTRQILSNYALNIRYLCLDQAWTDQWNARCTIV